MIPATHLRLGNIVLRDGEHHVIDAYDILSVSVGDIEFEGVPITEEILLKCGTINKGKLGGSIIYYQIKKFEFYFDSNGSYVFQFGISLTQTIQLQYLHQLMNIIFALTNEELIITL